VSSPAERARSFRQTMARGGRVQPPHSSPFHMLGRTCPACGRWIPTPAARLRKAEHRTLPECRHCKTQRTVRSNRERYAGSAERRKKHAAQSMKALVKRQAKLSDQAVNARKMWTGPELEIAAREDLTTSQVAAMLGRSWHAVDKMRGKIRTDPRKARMAGAVPPPQRKRPAIR